ncbi:MAG: subclass B1 metallo-beta-lactamase [Bacteroidales bacterium]|nr:subclass B1 metallo-beta-lactamase [Bacteroidales bacterium]MBN2819029.1 subclass B1 metallo-beta-lactamase [Bacteroidales bacterium]
MMKILYSFLILLLVQANGLTQSQDKKIKISDDLELIQISDDAYIHVSYTISPKWGRIGANGLLLIDNKQAFLFDSPWSDKQTEELISWAEDSMNIEIVGFIPNHWHEDCMGGLKYIQEKGINSYANQMTIEIAKTNDLPVPENEFKDSLELKLGEKLIKCYYFGAAHSMDNIVVWIPSEQILFPACMVKDMYANNLGNTADGDLNSYPTTITKVMNKFPTAKIVIPGHGAYGGKELLEHTLKLTKK